MSPTPVEWLTQSPDETRAAGARLGAALRPGDVVGLVGELGAGKTQFVKGVAAGLGVRDERAVNSPTFVLTNEYDARCRLFHLDAYRLRGASELAGLGFDEMCAAGGVVIVEWADRVRGAMPAGALWIMIEAVGEQTRRFRAAGGPPTLAEALLGVDGRPSEP